MIACVALLFTSTFSIIGKLNAAVLPVPVCANAFISSGDVKIWGIDFSWIVVGCSYPKSLSA